MFQYFLKVVSAQFRTLNGWVINTHQCGGVKGIWRVDLISRQWGKQGYTRSDRDDCT